MRVIEGIELKNYIEGQRLSKSKIAEDMGMTRSNLYQLFGSKTLTDETKKRFEEYFKTDIFTRVQTVQVAQEEEPTYEKAPELSRALENLTERGKQDAASIHNLTESQLKRDDQIDRLLRIMEVSLGLSERGAFQQMPGTGAGADYGDVPSQLVAPGSKKNQVSQKRSDPKKDK